MKKLITCAMLFAAASACATVANVQQIRPGTRPVYNSGTGVMPVGAQEAMEPAARQIAKDSIAGTGVSPVMINFFNPIQFPSQDWDIAGLGLGLFYSECCNFDGLNLGLVGIVNGHANGWLFDFVNVAYGDGVGLHTGLVNYMAGDFKGLQIGIANQIGSGDALQIGFYNGAYDMQGLQIGVINSAYMLQGMQIGLVNVITQADVSFLPIINWHF